MSRPNYAKKASIECRPYVRVHLRFERKFSAGVVEAISSVALELYYQKSE